MKKIISRFYIVAVLLTFFPSTYHVEAASYESKATISFIKKDEIPDGDDEIEIPGDSDAGKDEVETPQDRDDADNKFEQTSTSSVGLGLFGLLGALGTGFVVKKKNNDK